MSSEETERNPAGLAVTRDRRANAGARMSKLLQAEDEDEFYQTTYGGFAEEEDDNDYRSEESASEGTDSDIDIDENDEVKSDGEDEGGVKRTKRLVTKAYQEPKVATVSVSDVKSSAPQSKALPDPRPKKVELLDMSTERKALRASTAEKSRSTEDTTKEREAKAAMIRAIADRKKVASVRRLTQEELLAEAMVTEQINLRSLEMYQRLELEKKRSKVHRPVQRGPTIRYRSVTVAPDPVPIEETSVKKEEENDVGGLTTVTDDSKPVATAVPLSDAVPPMPKYSRNFITFTDETLFRQYFPYAPHVRGKPAPNPLPTPLPTPSKKHVCAVTGLPAKYFDPVTKSPYATAAAFKVLREEHNQRTAAVFAERRAEGGSEALEVGRKKSRTVGGSLIMLE